MFKSYVRKKCQYESRQSEFLSQMNDANYMMIFENLQKNQDLKCYCDKCNKFNHDKIEEMIDWD
jgi:hypothetical protein